MKRLFQGLLWTAIALGGAFAYAVIATHRGETLNSAYLVVAALCTYAIGYRFYSKWIAASVLALNDRRATPCEVHDDGHDFVKTNKWIVFGHHFAAISGPGPLVGPVLAAQFGYLPGLLWILIGVVLGGAVQDFVILFCSLRRDGKSLGQMVKDELNNAAGFVAIGAILAIMVILLAVLGLVVVKALAESPWGVFTVAATIPIAMLMGGYMRFIRVGKVMEASAMGVVLLLLAVWGGKFVHESAAWSKILTIRAEPLAWSIILYGLAASILPVWLLLAPRDYLSTFMKLGTIFALALGVCVVLPNLEMPALTKFVDGSGMVVAGKLFPFCFITIACGAISGFHTLIASGTTPKIMTRESHSRPVGYGAMCLESMVAVMALIAACTLEPGVYLSINTKGAGTEPAAIAMDTIAKVQAAGYPVTLEQMDRLAGQIGEKTLFGRTGGASTLAVGMAHIFSKAVSGRWLDLWYHFAIMFEALFILTTLDAGTRVGRYLLQDVLGHIWKPLGRTDNMMAGVIASVLVVAGWGYFLIQGVRDPMGGINSLWPLFGIANQLLAAIGLCLATTVILKMHLGAGRNPELAPAKRNPAYCLITLIPLVWLLAVTFTAGVEKIGHPSPKIGFLSLAHDLEAKHDGLVKALAAAKSQPDTKLVETATKQLRANEVLTFNQYLDAVVAGLFLALVTAIVLMSVWIWIQLIRRARPAKLEETNPTWLPDFAVAQQGRGGWLGFLTISVGLAKEWSGETALEREAARTVCVQPHDPELAHAKAPPKDAYLRHLDERYRSIRRCC